MRANQGIDATSCPDSMTMSIVLNPRVATDVRRRFVDVETTGKLTRGATIVDDLNVLGERANARIVYSASQRIFREMLFKMLRGERV
jgi:purine nucleosidase